LLNCRPGHALEVATGRIIAAHSKRRRHVEFLGFMNSLVAVFRDREDPGGDRAALCGTFHGSRRYLGMETAGKVQESLDHEAYCKKHAAWATDNTARDAFTECARC
jgi:hypothetical protein